MLCIFNHQVLVDRLCPREKMVSIFPVKCAQVPYMLGGPGNQIVDLSLSSLFLVKYEFFICFFI